MSNKLFLFFCLTLSLKLFSQNIIFEKKEDSILFFTLPKILDSVYTKDSIQHYVGHIPFNLKVNIVPVNSTASIDKEKIQNELNKIYYPYGVSVSLNVLNKIEDKSWDLNNDGKLDVGETGFLNFRTDEMKAVHRLNVNKNADEIYLYAMQAPSKESVEGDMPLGSQYGFLFGNPTPKTIAHEIAHGYFQLEHTFDDKYKLTQGSTNNLMDYANDSKLYKFQWDLVHDKGLMLSKIWQSDSAGESAYGMHYKYVLEILCEAIRKQYYKEYPNKKSPLSSQDSNIAIRLAHYASIYADYPREFTTINRSIAGKTTKDKNNVINNYKNDKGHKPYDENQKTKDHNLVVDRQIYGSYDNVVNSQSPSYINKNGGVLLHGMLAWWEGKATYNFKYLDYLLFQEENIETVNYNRMINGEILTKKTQKGFERQLDVNGINYLLTSEERALLDQNDINKLHDLQDEITILQDEIKISNNEIKNQNNIKDKKEIVKLKKELIEKNETSIKDKETSIKELKESMLLDIVFEKNSEYKVFYKEYQKNEALLMDGKKAVQRVKEGFKTGDYKQFYDGKIDNVEGYIGTENISKELQGVGLRDYTEVQQKKIAIALHQLQDIDEHKGLRWVYDEVDPKGMNFKIGIKQQKDVNNNNQIMDYIPKDIMQRKADMLGFKNEHPNADCGMNIGLNEVKSKKELLRKYINTLIFAGN